uniref:Uncharacterized protein n=1 Tax=Romanomermis culicivorax TaxID=13658 RepID=A0A915JNK3_ROMCU
HNALWCQNILQYQLNQQRRRDFRDALCGLHIFYIYRNYEFIDMALEEVKFFLIEYSGAAAALVFFNDDGSGGVFLLLDKSRSCGVAAAQKGKNGRNGNPSGGADVGFGRRRRRFIADKSVNGSVVIVNFGGLCFVGDASDVRLNIAAAVGRRSIRRRTTRRLTSEIVDREILRRRFRSFKKFRKWATNAETYFGPATVRTARFVDGEGHFVRITHLNLGSTSLTSKPHLTSRHRPVFSTLTFKGTSTKWTCDRNSPCLAFKVITWPAIRLDWNFFNEALHVKLTHGGVVLILAAPFLTSWTNQQTVKVNVDLRAHLTTRLAASTGFKISYYFE